MSPKKGTSKRLNHKQSSANLVGNLSEIGSLFIGRDEEVSKTADHLKVRHKVFVVLRGPGGVGKTHVANAAACKTSELFDAIYQLDLENARKASDVIDEFRRITKGDSIKTKESVCDRLSEGRTLLIVDTFERCYDAHTEGSSEIKGLMEDIWNSCSKLKIVVTSQFPVDFRGPIEIRIRPLDSPREYETSLPSAVEQGEYPAVRLFIDVVRNSYENFRLNDQNGKAVVALCGLAGGLPLLINILAPAFAKETQGGAKNVEKTLSDLMEDYHTRVIKGVKGTEETRRPCCASIGPTIFCLRRSRRFCGSPRRLPESSPAKSWSTFPTPSRWGTVLMVARMIWTNSSRKTF